MSVSHGGDRPILRPGDYLSFLEDAGLVDRESWPAELTISIGPAGTSQWNRLRRSERRSVSTPWGNLRNPGGRRGHLTTPLMGGAAMASLAELVFEAGTERIVLVGSCGSLIPGYGPGDVVVVDSALATEGPAAAYGQGPIVEGSAELAADVAARLAGPGTGLGHVDVVRSWTVAVPFLTTADLRDIAVSSNARVVEMEAASLFAVATHRRAEAVVVGIVADGLDGSEWAAPDLSTVGARLDEVLALLLGVGK